MDLVCPVLVGVHSVDVVPPITEQDAAGALPVGPVEVAQPDDGALVGVGELEDQALDGVALLLLLGLEPVDLFLELHFPLHHHAGAVGWCAGSAGHTCQIRAGRGGHRHLHAVEALELVVDVPQHGGVGREPVLDPLCDRLLAHYVRASLLLTSFLVRLEDRGDLLAR